MINPCLVKFFFWRGWETINRSLTFPPPPPQTRWNPLGPVGTRSNPFRPVETRSDLLKHVPPPPLPPIQKHLETARNYKKGVASILFISCSAIFCHPTQCVCVYCEHNLCDISLVKHSEFM